MSFSNNGVAEIGQNGGVIIRGDFNFVQGNFIGTAKDGRTEMGNLGHGVSITAANGNLIGGGPEGGGNTIAFNELNGVNVSATDTDAPGTSGINNRINSNSIFSNGKLGIDLEAQNPNSSGGDGVTKNDAGDADEGGNRR